MMSSEQQMKCHMIIHAASAAAASVGAGLAQIPGSDCVPIMAIQTTMVVSLGEVFGLSLSESSARAMVVSGLGASMGKGLANLLTGWIPGLGNVINAGTAVALTESLGWAIANEMAAQVQAA